MNFFPKVAIIGNLNYDITLGISRVPLKNEKSRADWCFQSAGGAPTNLAVWLHRLGFSTSLFSVVGKDDFGSLALNYLKGFGIDCSKTVLTDQGINTGLAVAFAQGGHNSMITTGGSYLSTQWDTLIDSIQVESFDHIHCHHRHVQVVRRMIDDKGLRDTVSISTDLNGIFDSDTVKASNFTFTNEEELAGALGRMSWVDDMIRIIRETEHIMYVTKGSEGSVRIDREGVCESLALITSVVDTTGGGDAYAAGVIAGELCKKGPTQCMELGHRLASVVVAHPTAQPIAPAVEDALSEMTRILEA